MSNKPTHTAYQVREYKSGGQEKSSWTRIGSAWTHPDGQGFNIRLQAMPLDGSIVLRTAKDARDGEEEEA